MHVRLYSVGPVDSYADNRLTSELVEAVLKAPGEPHSRSSWKPWFTVGSLASGSAHIGFCALIGSRSLRAGLMVPSI